MHREPFAADIAVEHILATPSLKAVSERVHYAMGIDAIAFVTGEIGSGKSTALRYVTEKLHPSEYRGLYFMATTGPISEVTHRFGRTGQFGRQFDVSFFNAAGPADR